MFTKLSQDAVLPFILKGRVLKAFEIAMQSGVTHMFDPNNSIRCLIERREWKFAEIYTDFLTYCFILPTPHLKAVKNQP